jgi:hypothetical protein
VLTSNPSYEQASSRALLTLYNSGGKQEP